jgi:hypothetical protein
VSIAMIPVAANDIDVRSRMGLYRDEADHIPKFPATDRVSESSSWLVDLQVTRF